MKYHLTFLPACLLLLCFTFSSSCGGPDQPASGVEGVTPGSAPGMKGAEVFQKNCKLCHGADGRLGLNGAKDLSQSVLPLAERVNIITHGKNLMTPFGKLLSATEIDSVAAFTFQLKQPISQ